jgi:hypothetical protein
LSENDLHWEGLLIEDAMHGDKSLLITQCHDITRDREDLVLIVARIGRASSYNPKEGDIHTEIGKKWHMGKSSATESGHELGSPRWTRTGPSTLLFPQSPKTLSCPTT